MIQVTNERENIKILVVAQDEAVMESLKGALPQGIDCVFSQSSLQALDIIEMWKPSIILVDSKASDIIHDAVNAQMRCTKYMHDVPVVVVSTKEDIYEKYRWADAAADYLMLPIQGDELAQRLIHALGASHSQSAYADS